MSMPFYNQVAYRIQGPSKTKGKNVILAAIASYALMAIGWLVFVAEKARQAKNGLNAFAIGALYGLVVYGVFNATNFVLFDKWNVDVVSRDVAWGTSWSALFTLGFWYFAAVPQK